MNVQRFTNPGKNPTKIWLEPWCQEFVVQQGQELLIRYEMAVNRDDLSTIQWDGESIVFWCEGDTYSVFLDGVELDT